MQSSQVKAKVIRRQSASQSVLLSGHHLKPVTIFSLSSFEIHFHFFIMLCPLWGEERSVISSCSWSSTAQSLSGLSHAGLVTIDPNQRLRLRLRLNYDRRSVSHSTLVLGPPLWHIARHLLSVICVLPTVGCPPRQEGGSGIYLSNSLVLSCSSPEHLWP
jgi:hypothetical protein